MITTYKTIRWAALLLAILMLCTACSTKGNDEESTTPPVESEAEETTDDVTEAPKEMLTIAEKSETEFGVILPDEANGVYLSLFSSFLRAFKDKYGALIVSTSDLMSQIRPSAPGTKEIILGNTVKAETAELNAMLSSAGGNRFGILVTDCKIIINGTSAYQCYLALDYFFSQFTSVDADGNPMASVESGFTYISEDTEDHRPYLLLLLLVLILRDHLPPHFHCPRERTWLVRGGSHGPQMVGSHLQPFAASHYAYI